MLIESRRASWAVALLFLVLGVAAYAAVLQVVFLGDDWMFLDLVGRSDSPLVMFAPLNARYTRPLMVLIYYLNFHLFGLWTFPAHLVGVLLHVLNAWLVYVLVLRLAPPPNRLMAFGAGAIFLLFAGHSEAISWVAGLADAAIVPFMIGSLFAFDRSLSAPRPWIWIAAATLLATAGLLAKETALLMPALIVVWGVAGLDKDTWPVRLRRTAACVAVLGVVWIVYWVFREARFGSALGAYTGMGSSEGQRIAIARMFLLRTFVPPGGRTVALWAHYLDLVLFAAIAAAIVLVGYRHREDRPGLMFAAAGLGIALLPALPLSISLTNTLTERYVYLATVFSCTLVAWLIVRLAPSRAVAAVLLIGAALVQWRYLAKSNAGWVRGGQVFQQTVSGLEEIARTHGPLTHATVILLNMPDAIDRPFVNGDGVRLALRLASRDIPQPETQLRIVAMHASTTGRAAVRVTQDGRVFSVDLGPDVLVEDWLRDSPDYAVRRSGPHGFAIELTPRQRRLLVAYSTAGQVTLATAIDAPPFGHTDLPPGDVACRDAAVRFAGWALDDEPDARVILEVERGSVWTPAGVAEWQRGTRPDVSALYPGFPAADRAEWNVNLSCGATDTARVRVVAIDRAGQRTVIGTRTITSK